MTREHVANAEEFARWWSETGEHELRQLLYWKWDPIGVNATFPWTVDEYDGYAPEIVSALSDGASEADIAELLETIERDRMGLVRESSDRLRTVASEMISWLAQSQESWKSYGPVRR